MTDTRYDEYSHAEDKLPFLYSGNILRTSRIRSNEANWHDDIELQLCRTGCGTVWIDGRQFPFRPGDMIAVNTGAIHYTGTETSLTYACLIIDAAFCRQADLDPTTLYLMERVQDARCRSLFDEIVSWYGTQHDICRTARLQMLTLQLLIRLREVCTKTGEQRPASVPAHETVKKTIRYIRENYDHKLSLDEIASNVYADKYGLTRIFKQLTKQTVISYVNNYRCQKAMALIAEGITVSEAARQCGFSNLSFFTKTFRQWTGDLPSDHKPHHDKQ